MKTAVHVIPLPAWARGTRYRPRHPPVFGFHEPDEEDIALALELIQALDDESRDWYAGFVHHYTNQGV